LLQAKTDCRARSAISGSIGFATVLFAASLWSFIRNRGHGFSTLCESGVSDVLHQHNK
jgi:hypothetical protein